MEFLRTLSSEFKSSNIFVEATESSLEVWCLPVATPRTPEFEQAVFGKFSFLYKRHPERKMEPGFYRFSRNRLVLCDRPRRVANPSLSNCEILGTLDPLMKDIADGLAGEVVGLLPNAIQWGSPSSVTMLTISQQRRQLGAALPTAWFALAASLGGKEFKVGTDDNLVQLDFSSGSISGSIWSQPSVHPLAFFRPRPLTECGPVTSFVVDPEGRVLLSGTSGKCVTVSEEQYRSVQRYGKSGWSLSAGDSMAVLSRRDVSVALSTLILV